MVQYCFVKDSSANINCTFLTLACVTGGYDDDELRDDILEYNKNGGWWNKLMTMNKARYYHGLSLVSVNDFPDCY